MHWATIREKAVLIHTVNEARSVLDATFFILNFSLLTRARPGSLRASGKGACESTSQLTLPGPVSRLNLAATVGPALRRISRSSTTVRSNVVQLDGLATP